MTSIQDRHAVRAELEIKGNHGPSPASKHRNTLGKNTSDKAVPKKSNGTVPDGADSSSEEFAGSDEEANDDNADDEAEEPEDDALPRKSNGLGLGKGKGKGPGIRVQADSSKSLEKEPTRMHRGAGLKVDTTVVKSPKLKRKRRESDTSVASVLEDFSTPLAYPRKKLSRGLQHNDAGLLAYLNVDFPMGEFNDHHTVSEDDYEGVNDVSQSEEGDSDIERFEEDVMLDTDHDKFFRRSSIESANDDILQAIMNQSMVGELPDEHETFGNTAFGVSSDSRKYSDSSAKRVRFLDEVRVEAFDDSSSSTESDDMESTFPDLFHDRIKDPDAYLVQANSDSDTSYWDLNDDEHNLAFEDEYFDEDSSDAGSSGYESDTGDTTEEDEPPPPSAVSAKSVLQRPSSAASNHAASPSPFRRNSHPSTRKKAPLLGHFVVDPFKVVACVDVTGRNITFQSPIIPNQNSLRFPNNLSGSSSSSFGQLNSPKALHHDDSDFSETSQPIGTDVMLGGLFGSMTGSSLTMDGALVGPVEAFFPNPRSLDAGGHMLDGHYTSDSMAENQESAIDDFLDFGDDETDEDNDEADLIGANLTPHASGAEDFPVVGRGRSQSIGDAMLGHLVGGGGVVTSFRNNQNRHRNVAQQPADPTLRASASKPVRSGKTAEAPITPLRKRGNSFRHRKATEQNNSPLLKRSDAAVSKRGRGPRMGTFA